MFGYFDSQVVIFHEDTCNRHSISSVIAEPLILNLLVAGLLKRCSCTHARAAVPALLSRQLEDELKKSVVVYDNCIELGSLPVNAGSEFIIISNARFVSSLDIGWPKKLAQAAKCDVLTVEIDPNLAAGSECLKITSDNRLAGVKRIYADSAGPASMPMDWPYVVLLRQSMLNDIGFIELDFSRFLSRLAKCRIESMRFGSNLLDMTYPPDLHSVLLEGVGHGMSGRKNLNSRPDCRILGPVMIDESATLEENTTIIGPAIIGRDTLIGRNSTIAKSIIAGQQRIKPHSVISDTIVVTRHRITAGCCDLSRGHAPANFRSWPLWSYPRIGKRIFDILFALIVLALFAPVILIVAILVKTTSKGPAFFGDKRQGLHGRNFHCLKFRSMIVGADRLQQKLRKLNEVDGPQFKMEDDPRVTTVGKFMRNTYIDEIPQFWNVLTGKMSIVGPRPSPESENSLCASWRDARLSVRPGITGYWQVCRTRLPGTDFQEWVYYDKLYVKNISLKLDLWICWRTAVYILKAFLKQF